MKTIALVTLFLGMQLLAQDRSKQPAQATTTDLVNFAPGGLIRVTTASSNLFVEAWDRPEVEIRTIKSSRSAGCLDDIRVVTAHPSATETIFPARTTIDPRSITDLLATRLASTIRALVMVRSCAKSDPRAPSVRPASSVEVCRFMQYRRFMQYL